MQASDAVRALVDPLGTVQRVARVLWGHALDVHPLPGAVASAQRAVLTLPGGSDDRWVLHLPTHDMGDPTDWSLAVACHAAAHRHFGGPPQSRTGLKPIQQVLFGVLEDARVEWLALQELPGLRAVWWPFHGGEAARRGNGFEDLLARLSASLLDPDKLEPHPWVARVRQRFFEPDGHTLALRTPQAVREAASTLGHDIGQMRLPFNARTYRVHAACRDDNSHLWLPDDSLPTSDVSLTLDAEPPREEGGATRTIDEQPSALDASAVHAEWDHRIRRYRADWCSVHTPPLPMASVRPLAPSAQRDARRLVHRLAALRGPPQRVGGWDRHGDDLHATAVVDVGIDQRLGRTPDPRVHQRQQRLHAPLAVLLLVDASRSTAGPGWAGSAPMLHDMLTSAFTAALALQFLGHRTAVSAFSSHGRHRVCMPVLKAWDEPLKGGGLPLLPSEGSTRLGAVLRHGLHLCRIDAQKQPAWRRVILVISDGELHDIDVHDSAYLGADLRRAMGEAARQGVGVGSLLCDGRVSRACDPAFDRTVKRHVRSERDVERALPWLLQALV